MLLRNTAKYKTAAFSRAGIGIGLGEVPAELALHTCWGLRDAEDADGGRLVRHGDCMHSLSKPLHHWGDAAMSDSILVSHFSAT